MSVTAVPNVCMVHMSCDLDIIYYLLFNFQEKTKNGMPTAPSFPETTGQRDFSKTFKKKRLVCIENEQIVQEEENNDQTNCTNIIIKKNLKK